MHQMLTYTYTPPVQKNTNKWLYATSVSTQQNDCSNNRHYIAQTAGESTQGEKLIMARCSLCATKSRCHAECCQPHSSFKPQNKKACKPFLLFFVFGLSFKGHLLSCKKCQPVHEDHVLNVEKCKMFSFYSNKVTKK